MNKKTAYFSKHTKRLIDNVFPEKFEMVRNKNSNGYKFVNMLYGIEIDTVYDNLDDARHNNSLELFDYSTNTDFYEVVIKDNIVDNIVYGDGLPVKITNNFEFEHGDPTRFETIGKLSISGIPYGPVGIEYLRDDPDGSGILLVNLNLETDEAVNTLGFQSFQIASNAVGDFDTENISGVNFLVREQSFEAAGFDELITPKQPHELRKLYPATRDIRAPRSGVADNPLEDYVIDHYTPFNGFFWDDTDNTYKAVGYDSEFYFDQTGEKVYYRTELNNPYGTGVYETVFVPLEQIPISGTLRLWDVDNLTDSGLMTEIMSSGTQSWFNSGVYPIRLEGEQQLAFYIGYQSGVPHEYLPEETDDAHVDAYPYKVTSWDYLRESGGLNDQFEWEEYPANDITNGIRIDNPISRYVITYQYKTGRFNNYISALNSSKFIRYNDGNYLFSQVDKENNEVELDYKLSKEISTRKAVTFDGHDLRPGSIIDTVEVTADVNVTTTEQFDKSNTTFAIERKYPGHSEVAVPNKRDYRSYLLDEKLHHDYIGSLTLINEYSTVDNINIGTYEGQRLMHTSGDFYYHISGYYDLETDGDSHRFFKTGWNIFRPLGSIHDQEMIISSDGSGQFWSLSLTNEGYFLVRTHDTVLISYDNIIERQEFNEVILERNMGFDNGNDIYQYNLYYRFGNNAFRKFRFTTFSEDSEIPSGAFTRIYSSGMLDVQYVSIYEEGLEYLNAR
tara:strand:- start:1657 stop:3846 length:2190 start_codon:yes stop_codon:yes gene_type:complete